MNSNLQLFRNSDFGALEILIDGSRKEWFPATESASILGYTNPYYAIRRHCIDDECVNHEVIDSLGRKQQKKYINEGNLYRLIVKSTLPRAYRFERWVFNEVLPSIRRHGAYMTPATLNQANMDQGFTSQLLTQLNAEQSARIEAEKMIEVLTPKAELYDVVINTVDLMDMKEVADILDLGVGRNELFRILRELNLLISSKQHRNLPRRKYVDRGYFKVKLSSESKARPTTYATQKGLSFIRRKVKEYIRDSHDNSKEIA